MPDLLVIVPCGKSKIWDKHPDRAPTAARDAYTSAPFKLNRRYAECFGDAWVVLSAKYGLIEPEFEITGPYEVAFTKPRTCPIATESLQRQVKSLRLNRYSSVVGLGGAAYRKAISDAFAPSPAHLVFPFAGLPIGKMMQATKRAVEEGESGFDRGARSMNEVTDLLAWTPRFHRCEARVRTVQTPPGEDRSTMTTRSGDRAVVLGRLGAICRAFPGAVEIGEGSVGDPVYKVGGKIFAMQHGVGERMSLWCKAPPGVQGALVGTHPDRMFVPPYVGHRGWIGIWLDGDPDWAEIADLIDESYRMTAPKRLLKELDDAERGQP